MSDLELVENAEGLAPIGNDKICIGYVKDINGPGALGVPEFVPSRAELLVLLKHYIEARLDIDYDYFCYEQSGSSEIRVRQFATLRACRIIDVLHLDEEAVEKVVKEVEDAFGAKHDSVWWRVFMGTATAEDRQQYEKDRAEFEKAMTDEPQEENATEQLVRMGILTPPGFSQQQPAAPAEIGEDEDPFA